MSLLLPEKEQAARDILSLVGECGNAKEVIIGIQEGVERLESAELDEDKEKFATYPSQLIVLIALYESCEASFWIINQIVFELRTFLQQYLA
jgi:hypothetical protein